MEYQKKIDEIIAQRKSHLERIKKYQDFFGSVQSDIKRFEEYRNKLLNDINQDEGVFSQMKKQYPDIEEKIKNASSDNALNYIGESIDECNRLINRFNRDSINISVIGRARQGKSCLLQSISGLNQDVIPTEDGGDCTGTTSVICNEPGTTEAHATVAYYSKDEIVEQVNAYLENMNLTRRIGSVDDIPLLEPFVAEYEPKIKNKNTDSCIQSLFDHFKKYVEHYDDYRDCLNKKEENITESEIRAFVAQYDDKKKTYKYLATKEVSIFKEFVYREAGKIVLVDTIGLGDTSLGIKEKMYNTLKKNSDAAVIVRMPQPNGDDWRKEDDAMYDELKHELGEQLLEKWLFLALNVAPKLNNGRSAGVILDTLQKKSLKLANTFTVDCKDKDKVTEDLLKPALEFLADNLESVDDGLMNNLRDLCTSSKKSIAELYDKAKEMISSIEAQRRNFDLEDTSYKKIHEAFTRKLFSYTPVRDKN